MEIKGGVLCFVHPYLLLLVVQVDVCVSIAATTIKKDELKNS